MNKLFYYFVLLLVFLSCNGYEPFASLSEKKITKKYLKNTLLLSNKQLKQIKGNDSLLHQIALSRKKENVSNELIKRRLDSFLLNRYSLKQLYVILDFDREFSSENGTIEFSNDVKDDAPSFETANEMKKFMDSLVSKTLGMPKKVQDSLNRQNKKN